MPEADTREELQAMHIEVQAVMKLRSRRQNQEAEKDRTLTPHFIVSVSVSVDYFWVELLVTQQPTLFYFWRTLLSRIFSKSLPTVSRRQTGL
jgi:hypothetical protein